MSRIYALLFLIFWAASAPAQHLSAGAETGAQLWLRNRPNTQSQEAVLSPGVRAFLRWQVKHDWSLELGLSGHGRKDTRSYSYIGDFDPSVSHVKESYQERLYAAGLALQYKFAGKDEQKCKQYLGFQAGLSLFDPGLIWNAYTQRAGSPAEFSKGRSGLEQVHFMAGFQYQFQYQFFPCWMAQFTAAAGGDPYRIFSKETLPPTLGFQAPISFFSFSAGLGRLLH
ncbi:MAG: hypothetical protein JST27_01535 [Bacteroidetes bacterium]|nr:hypothetical protein [Bacteroidota bacterium]